MNVQKFLTSTLQWMLRTQCRWKHTAMASSNESGWQGSCCRSKKTSKTPVLKMLDPEVERVTIIFHTNATNNYLNQYKNQQLQRRVKVTHAQSFSAHAYPLQIISLPAHLCICSPMLYYAIHLSIYLPLLRYFVKNYAHLRHFPESPLSETQQNSHSMLSNSCNQFYTEFINCTFIPLSHSFCMSLPHTKLLKN